MWDLPSAPLRQPAVHPTLVGPTMVQSPGRLRPVQERRSLAVQLMAWAAPRMLITAALVGMAILVSSRAGKLGVQDTRESFEQVMRVERSLMTSPPHAYWSTFMGSTRNTPNSFLGNNQVQPVFHQQGLHQTGISQPGGIQPGMTQAGRSSAGAVLEVVNALAACQTRLLGTQQELSDARSSLASAATSRQLLAEPSIVQATLESTVSTTALVDATVAALSLAVRKGNEDLLGMNMRELVAEIEKLRIGRRRMKVSITGLWKQKQVLLKKLAADGGHKTDSSAAFANTGYACQASRVEIQQYLAYKEGGLCPDDWFFVQSLIFEKGCFALPRRKCRAATPSAPVEPLPLPQSLFSQSSLEPANVLWPQHQCPSFECLNRRAVGECKQCFNMTFEERRFRSSLKGAIPLDSVVAMKPDGLRIGLDVGGGTGTFAAHMAHLGVTIMTTARNVETASGNKAGIPYMEAIAARGLIPLHLPHQARLPLYDGVLDIIHSTDSLRSMNASSFAELMYEWDRVLRTGGLLWLEMFSAKEKAMPAYVAALDVLGYKRHYWDMRYATGAPTKVGTQLAFLNCVLEKRGQEGTSTTQNKNVEQGEKQAREFRIFSGRKLSSVEDAPMKEALKGSRIVSEKASAVPASNAPAEIRLPSSDQAKGISLVVTKLVKGGAKKEDVAFQTWDLTEETLSLEEALKNRKT